MSNEALEKENQQLREQLAKYKNKKKERWQKGIKVSKYVSTKLLGTQLKNAITNFFTELEEKRNVSKDTVSELLSAIFMRTTRIGFFLLITSLLPTLLILLQVYYLRNQNQLIKTQNNRLDQQTYLQEASRRSYMIGVLDGMIKDVTSGVNASKSNINRLIALSKNLKPYKYLENDHLISRQMSPERGYLLLALLESDLNLNKVIDNNTKETIISALDFSYAELKNTDLTQLEISYMDLNNATLDNSNFTKSSFSKGVFDKASLLNVNLENSDILNCRFEAADLTNASFANSYIFKCSFENTNLKNVDFSNTDMRKNSFKGAKIEGVNFEKAEVDSGWMARMEEELDPDNFKYLSDHFDITIKGKKAVIYRKN